MKKSRIYAALGAMAVPFALFSGLAGAQQTPRTVYLYNAALGTAAVNVNAAKTAPWGNGAVSNARDMDYEGAPVLSLTTRNLQEGVRFDLTAPTDFEPYRANGFLRLRVRFQSTTPPAEANPEGMNPPEGTPQDRPRRRRRQRRDDTNLQLKPAWQGAAQFGNALPPLGGFGGPPAPGDETNPDGTPVEALPPAQKTSISELGITLLRENGITVGRIPVNLETSTPDEGGWRLFVLPLKEMTSTTNASGPVKSIILTSDAEDTFYLAQAALVIETGQMTVSIRRPSDVQGAQIAEIQVKPEPLTLIADVEAGAADPAVEWNFDADNVGNLPPGVLSTPPADAGGEMNGDVPVPAPPTDPRLRRRPTPPGAEAAPPADPAAATVGPRLDARGLTATFTYPNEEQNYRVEVTVRDRSGQKQPVKTSIVVRVRG